MKFIHLFYLLFITSFLATGLAQTNKAKRVNPMTPIEEVKGLPHVLIIGDSISIGYTLPTRALLQGKVNLHRIPTNGGPTTKGLAEIEKWLKNRKWDLIHFNWGLHDLKYMGKDGTNLVPKEKGGVVQVPLADYEKNLEKLVVRMKKSAKQLVWRNTTPIPAGSKARYVGDSLKYNQAAARVMKRHKIPTLDLFTPSKKNMKEWMRNADVHYYPHGSQALAKIVADDVLNRLEVKFPFFTARTAANASIKPYPNLKSGPSGPRSDAVSRKISLISQGLSSGLTESIKAATPAACGPEKELPAGPIINEPPSSLSTSFQSFRILWEPDRFQTGYPDGNAVRSGFNKGFDSE
jgi:acyl-CoA thioesterase-1